MQLACFLSVKASRAWAQETLAESWLFLHLFLSGLGQIPSSGIYSPYL